ncbi:vWA domain-containing protein [Pseudobacillus badius]|uniref:vWA domain-containing protein n=1 Tax=Bacillus badius TaxID=1455 RepID=UPI003CEC9C7A
MNTKTRFSKFQDQSTIHLDRFDKRRFSYIYQNSKSMKKMSTVFEGFEYLLGDIWGSLYKMNLVLKEEVPEHLERNQAFMDRIMSDPAFDSHRSSTKLDELLSAIGTMKFGEEVQKWTKQQAEENERMKELIEQIQQMRENHKNGSKEEQIKPLMSALNYEIKVTLADPKNGFTKAMEQAIASTKDVKENVDRLIGGPGNREAELKKVPLRDQLLLAETLSNNRKLKDIAEWAGRMKTIARKKQKTKYKESIDRNGITVGSDIERLLASELAQYMHPATKLDFARRLSERETFIYDKQGKERLGKGAIILCLDQSGSMKNLDSQAKGFALALMWIAKRQKRDFAYIPFSNLAKTTVFPKGKITVPEMTKMATEFLDGGTNFQKPLQHALKVIDQSRFKYADIIFITDGDSIVKKEFIDQFNKMKRKKGFNVLSLVLGNKHYEKYVEPFSNRIVSIKGLMDENSFEAFEI